MTRVLVTGAGGHIGRGLCAQLKTRVQAREIESLPLADLRFHEDVELAHRLLEPGGQRCEIATGASAGLM